MNCSSFTISKKYLFYPGHGFYNKRIVWLQATGEIVYKEIAKSSFDFLLSKTFTGKNIKVISNKGWLHKVKSAVQVETGGEQPIDVSYTILALSKFYEVFKEEGYKYKMGISFNWFLGANHLQQVIYNPCTGGCYDGPEENYVNLNQGAESTVSYLMARLTLEKFCRSKERRKLYMKQHLKLNMQNQFYHES